MVWSSVACFEEFGTRSESYDTASGMQFSVTLRVSSANRNALINDLLLNAREWPEGGMMYPPVARSVVARPSVPGTIPVPQQQFIYDEYLLDVTYSSDSAQDIVAETIEPEADFMRLDHTFFRWKSNGAPLSPGEAPGILKPKLKLVRQFFNRSTVPSAILLAGHVHNASYTSPTFGITFAAKTLMLIPQPISTTLTTMGGTGFNYSASFLYEPQEWNKFFRLDTSTYDAIVMPNGADYNSYPLTNLLALLV